MTRFLPLKPIYLALLCLLVFYSLVAFSLAAGLLLAFCLYQLWYRYDRSTFFKVIGILLVFGTCLLILQARNQAREAQLPRQVSQLELIPDSLVLNGDQLSFRAKSQGYTYQVFYRLKSKREQAFYRNLSKTVLLEVTGQVSRPPEQENFHGFNYRAYLRYQGVYGLLSVDKVRAISLPSRLSLLERLHQLRRAALVYCQQHFPKPMSHYMTGLLFGYLDKDFSDMSETYTSLGIIHLFALSGMQVGFFINLYRKILLRLGLRRDHVDIIQLPFSVFYAGMTGFSVSVLRSLIQALLARLGMRKLDNLGLTVLVMFVLQPYFLMTAAGLLSFSYAFILAMLDSPNLSSFKRQVLQASILALGVLPILLFLFGTFQPLSIPLTLILSIIFDSFLLPLLTGLLVLSPFYKLVQVNMIFKALEGLIAGLHHWIGRPLILGSPNLLLLLGLLLVLVLLHDYWSRKRLRLACILLLGLFLVLTKHPLTNELTLINVGQGDSILLRDSWGKTILVDTGGKVNFSKQEAWQRGHPTSNASKTLIPYLKSRGIGKIDQLVLTHSDSDHVGDLEDLAKQVDIGEILVTAGSLTKPSFARRLRALKLKVRLVKAGDSLSIMGSHLRVLAPSKLGDGGNNDSIVLYGKLLNQTFLLTGDLEKEGEEELIKRYPQLRVDVLKAGHHGSKGSSSPAFLKTIHAKIALVSAGKHNRYKHPHQETLERFAQEGMCVYRTDQQGAIRFIGFFSWKIQPLH